ncbi:uncharacterized protein B0I36DRAFT_107031 [Microdochium trichocladiopsis]|uniref:Uncharacterized protein n=1 Tax=Microdochium trichocladiopsis TaxID=1682393 RepID=A0A9P8YBX2_9PEZI|nr:uncharacterized protein B0I36DRAFT_107031 [Microdochium trichocladiopsis]KAH7033278.1 hypothetical protein B0I36DRAFT_107031 [Microdochium trichocladiopsis]
MPGIECGEDEGIRTCRVLADKTAAGGWRGAYSCFALRRGEHMASQLYILRHDGTYSAATKVEAIGERKGLTTWVSLDIKALYAAVGLPDGGAKSQSGLSETRISSGREQARPAVGSFRCLDPKTPAVVPKGSSLRQFRSPVDYWHQPTSPT